MTFFAIPLLMTSAGALTDLSRGKVYNFIVFPAFLAGMLLRFHQGGTGELAAALLSGMIPLVITLPFYLIPGRTVGGGDIKLLVSCCVFLGLQQALRFCFLVFAIAAVRAVTVLLAHGSRKAGVPLAVPVWLGMLVCSSTAYIR